MPTQITLATASTHPLLRHVYHQAAMAVCIGYTYCLTFALSGSLVPSTLLHSLNNLAASFQFCSNSDGFRRHSGGNWYDKQYGGVIGCNTALGGEERAPAMPPYLCADPYAWDTVAEIHPRDELCGVAGPFWVPAQALTLAVYVFIGVACLRRFRSCQPRFF